MSFGLHPTSRLPFPEYLKMTKQNSNLNDRPIARASRGVTLVELLVVVTILSIIFAVLIPRLRAVNEDRNIREAARVVASAFSKASSRAINDGSAGLLILPNRNFQQATFDNFVPNQPGPYFAGTRIFQMRRLSPYIGDSAGALASAAGAAVVIDRPFEHDPAEDRRIIQANDEISFNGSSFRYRITGVTESPTDLSLTIATSDNSQAVSAPPPNLGTTGVPFVIHRQPRRLESSRVELPDGYIIDLRYSGPLLPNDDTSSTDEEAGTFLNQNQSDTFLAGADPVGVVLHFDATGGVERMFFVDTNNVAPIGTEAIKLIQPTGALNWLVTEFDPNAFGANGNYASAQNDPIFAPNNKWVTVDHVTGSVNVASAAVPARAADDLRAEISGSRAIANNRQSASQ